MKEDISNINLVFSCFFKSFFLNFQFLSSFYYIFVFFLLEFVFLQLSERFLFFTSFFFSLHSLHIY